MTTGLKTHYTICAFDEVCHHLDTKPHDVVISIEHPNANDTDGKLGDLPSWGHETPVHKFIFWDNDIEELPDMFTPAQAEQALAILRAHRGGNILVHCRAGKARSAAVALMGIADELGAGRELDAVAHLNKIRPIATPNPLVVRRADALLGRDGALVEAVQGNEMIQAGMPAYIEAKLRGILRYGHYDPEKAFDLIAAIGEERAAEIISDMKKRAAGKMPAAPKLG